MLEAPTFVTAGAAGAATPIDKTSVSAAMRLTANLSKLFNGITLHEHVICVINEMGVKITIFGLSHTVYNKSIVLYVTLPDSLIYAIFRDRLWKLDSRMERCRWVSSSKSTTYLGLIVIDGC